MIQGNKQVVFVQLMSSRVRSVVFAAPDAVTCGSNAMYYDEPHYFGRCTRMTLPPVDYKYELLFFNKA